MGNTRHTSWTRLRSIAYDTFVRADVVRDYYVDRQFMVCIT